MQCFVYIQFIEKTSVQCQWAHLWAFQSSGISALTARPDSRRGKKHVITWPLHSADIVDVAFGYTLLTYIEMTK